MKVQVFGAIFAAVVTLCTSAATPPAPLNTPDIPCNGRSCIGQSGAPGARCGKDGMQIACADSMWCVNVDNALGLDGTTKQVGVCAPAGTTAEQIPHCKDLNCEKPGIGGSLRYCSADGVVNYCSAQWYCENIDNHGDFKEKSPKKAICLNPQPTVKTLGLQPTGDSKHIAP
ncbi:hypothetical protein QFC22_003346 [Naganishia vaughanmartiniae]|uniref:Uncharacterized protein n=1 Tax=Naganishia vaughanmartiniae TaxID=1424756 RepID=A0ACC2X8N1_9TREE|nr:hypothetical protein QFC22_003346 [Naganishia vaughanmartiniae]